MKRLAVIGCLSLSLLLNAPTSSSQVACKTDIAPNGAHLGCTEQTKNAKCTAANGAAGRCSGTIECTCQVEKKKGGGLMALALFATLAALWSLFRLRPWRRLTA